MFDAFASIQAVTAVIRAEYGERISHETVRRYKHQTWYVRRKRQQARQAVLTAFEELANEGRN